MTDAERLIYAAAFATTPPFEGFSDARANAAQRARHAVLKFRATAEHLTKSLLDEDLAMLRDFMDPPHVKK